MSNKEGVSVFLSRKISHLMPLLTLMVVYIHYSTSFVNNVTESMQLRVIDYMGQCVSRNAVPLFFFISAILSFYKIDNISDCIVLAKKKLFSLGIPYLVWNIIGMLFYFSLDLLNGECPSVSLNVILDGIFHYRFMYTFWYIFYLIILSILSPIIWCILNKKYISIIIIIVLSIIHCFDIFSWGFIYYFLGAFLACHYKGLLSSPVSPKIARVAAFLFVSLQIMRIVCFDPTLDFVSARNLFPYLLYELFSPICLFFSLDIINFTKYKVHEIEKHTFMVYASHIMVISLVSATIFESQIGIPSTNIVYTLFVFFSVPIVIYVSSSLVSMGIKKYLPLIFKLLTGGR
ncbi:MAG: acyltransferase family protein [Bacteroidales bacterium]|nr:acyltransferase family protein [Bacteroidales bacterium]